MNPFKWIRELAKAAVVNGVADGLREVTPDTVDAPADVALFQAKLEAARRVYTLPAMDDDTGKRRKPRVADAVEIAAAS